MSDIPGYINPRTLGNDEPHRILQMDIFFEQELWDRYIANKNSSRRDLYTWDAFMLAFTSIWGFGGPPRISREQLLKGIQRYGKIGHHKPCTIRVYEHPQIMALCVGLAKPLANESRHETEEADV